MCQLREVILVYCSKIRRCAEWWGEHPYLLHGWATTWLRQACSSTWNLVRPSDPPPPPTHTHSKVVRQCQSDDLGTGMSSCPYSFMYIVDPDLTRCCPHILITFYSYYIITHFAWYTLYTRLMSFLVNLLHWNLTQERSDVIIVMLVMLNVLCFTLFLFFYQNVFSIRVETVWILIRYEYNRSQLIFI